MKINRHQYMPVMNDEEFAALKENILEHGVIVPVLKTPRGDILDGHHRDQAWRELRAQGHEVPQYPVRVVRERFTTTEQATFVRSINSVRRHLSVSQRRRLVAEQLRDTPEWANARVARAIGVSGRLVTSVRAEMEEGGQIPRLGVLVRSDGRVHVRSETTSWEPQQEESKPIATATLERPAEPTKTAVATPQPHIEREVKEEADAPIERPEPALDPISDTETIGVMVDGGLKVCEYAIARHERNHYKLSGELRNAHLRRWGLLRSRIREMGRTMQELTEEPKGEDDARS